jgi:methyltransferase (TIGR00027 family)
MKPGRASRTAEWVAAARSLGTLLPREERLAYDPYGGAFATGVVRRATDLLCAESWLLPRLLATAPTLHAFLLWMQLRTRALDDVLLEFVGSGGRQIVVLGAGYDCRAARFAHLLGEANVFEIDHPLTQAHKREVVELGELRTPARYVAWDFEASGMAGLGARLAREGLNRSHRVLTLWEGVTMYLDEPTIDATLAMLRGLGAAGSWLAFNYVDQRVVREPRGDQVLTQRLAASVGEPYRFGWDPPRLPAWLAERGFALMSDVTDHDLAQRYLSPALWPHFSARNRHVALARVRLRVSSRGIAALLWVWRWRHAPRPESVWPQRRRGSSVLPSM